jgi:hypothetical protein
MSQTALKLDDQSLDVSALSMPALTREICLQAKPNWLLRRLMNALESKRQAAGMGWSRSWNKVGLTIFRAHTADLCKDADYFAALHPLVDRLLARLDDEYRAFGQELIADTHTMSFSFYHNAGQEPGADTQYEGVTIGFGRRAAGEPSKRDRLDLILEDRREGGGVDGVVDRVRLVVCPWHEYREKRFAMVEQQGHFASGDVADAYRAAVGAYNEWKGEPRRQFLHWSYQYIDYFGPRQFIPLQSSFT